MYVIVVNSCYFNAFWMEGAHSMWWPHRQQKKKNVQIIKSFNAMNVTVLAETESEWISPQWKDTTWSFIVGECQHLFSSHFESEVRNTYYSIYPTTCWRVVHVWLFVSPFLFSFFFNLFRSAKNQCRREWMFWSTSTKTRPERIVRNGNMPPSQIHINKKCV